MSLGVLLPMFMGPCMSAATQPEGVISGIWQHHNVTFSYFGITSLFSCAGLEYQTRQILLHLGARKDSKVYAQGCPGPVNAPSPRAFVTADFYTLVPAADDAGGSETVKARWTGLEVTPQHPRFMREGDCELIQAMKDVITMNFSLRDLNYRTSCFPNDVTHDGFAVMGQVLREGPDSPVSAARERP